MPVGVQEYTTPAINRVRGLVPVTAAAVIHHGFVYAITRAHQPVAGAFLGRQMFDQATVFLEFFKRLLNFFFGNSDFLSHGFPFHFSGLMMQPIGLVGFKPVCCYLLAL